MRRILLPAIASALLWAVPAQADIGIVGVSPAHARPGDHVRVTAGGYLGMTHQAFTVVLVPAARAPQPYSCMNGTTFCEPSYLPSALDRPPFKVVGSIKHWRRVGPRGVQQGQATLVFRLPAVAPGRYVFGLFCPSCIRGPKGSLIVAYDMILRVERQLVSVRNGRKVEAAGSDPGLVRHGSNSGDARTHAEGGVRP